MWETIFGSLVPSKSMTEKVVEISPLSGQIHFFTVGATCFKLQAADGWGERLIRALCNANIIGSMGRLFVYLHFFG